MIRNGICLLLFFTLFAIGLFVDAKSVDKATLYGWPLFVMASTVTNLGLMAMVCSFAGTGTLPDCALRGLVIYLIALIGTVGIFPEAMLATTSTEQYAKVAGLVGYVSIKVAIENPPVVEWIKSFGIPSTQKKDG